MKDAIGVECCGVRCTTPYCPHCGQDLSPDPVRSLVKYLDTHKRQLESSLEKMYRREGPQGLIQKRERAVAKWTAWRDAVAEMADRTPVELLNGTTITNNPRFTLSLDDDKGRLTVYVDLECPTGPPSPQIVREYDLSVLPEYQP